MFSERSLNEMGDEMYKRFVVAARTAPLFPADGWRAAFDVVLELLSCVWQQEHGNELDRGKLTTATKNFTALPLDRQTEITRHLDMVLGGAIEDSLDVDEAKRVAEARVDGDRAQRAWKFFEPEPARPRFFILPPPTVSTGTWVRIWFGAAALALGLISALVSIGSGNSALGLSSLVVFGGGLACAVRFGITREVRARRLAWHNTERGYTVRPQAAVSPGHWVSTDFVRQVHEQVERRFRAARPHLAGDWKRASCGMREYLKWRFVALYGKAQVEAPAIDWLIHWHARRVAQRWRDGTMFDYRVNLLPSSGVGALFGAGAAAAVLGFAGLVASGSGYGGGAILLAVGAALAWGAVVRLFATRQLTADQEAAGRRLPAEEEQAYRDWLGVLADRPADAEIARWLGLDKSFLKTSAVKRAGLTNYDVVAHVVLTEGASGAQRARVLGGPMRYSAYVARVFLLTRSGVREFEVDLDFLTGNEHDERRKGFRYEALASAQVSEVGVRYADDKRYIVRPDDTARLLDVHTLRRRAFRLSLISGEAISVVVETYRGASDVTESEDKLYSMALETSGIAGALHVLEAVAAEGRDWIPREQERRRRRSEAWGLGPAPRLLGDGLRDPFGDDDQDGAEVPAAR
ncbi:hypothetical protein [Amycolatopsis sp. FDAARGOS 1241]|uniref:hypothetical protein n=1 Tax=Amycolatopsis sp. FDAARGOS 1241 TaxID=2778070 RepID=UPI001950A3CF|nr:hypothetical protein [Amycolatopsis sp. FDAARGOS 1241]QRP47141.1 hypothetical protein I6J71_03715 [Amycolatopsis sp. FDAARGOS 1241]